MVQGAHGETGQTGNFTDRPRHGSTLLSSQARHHGLEVLGGFGTAAGEGEPVALGIGHRELARVPGGVAGTIRVGGVVSIIRVGGVVSIIGVGGVVSLSFMTGHPTASRYVRVKGIIQ
jgi:hypothetical protein